MSTVQVINLLPPNRTQRARRLSRTMMFALALLAAVALTLHALYEERKVAATRVAAAQIDAQTERLQRLLQQQAPAPSTDLAALERDVASLEAVAARLAGGPLGADGFAGTLRVLAQARTDGVWLTAIKLDRSSGSVTLEGRALQADRVPALIDALGQQPTLAGTRFSAMEMKPDDGALPGDLGGPAPLRFRLAAHLAATPMAAAGSIPAVPAAVQSATLAEARLAQGAGAGR